jgi:hypothetical protein
MGFNIGKNVFYDLSRAALSGCQTERKHRNGLKTMRMLSTVWRTIRVAQQDRKHVLRNAGLHSNTYKPMTWILEPHHAD